LRKAEGSNEGGQHLGLPNLDTHVDFIGTDPNSENSVVISVVASDQAGYLKSIVRTTNGFFKNEIFVGYDKFSEISEKFLEKTASKLVKKYVLASTESETGIGKLKDLRILKDESGNVKDTLKKLEEQEVYW
jgi:hypothetical protein